MMCYLATAEIKVEVFPRTRRHAILCFNEARKPRVRNRDDAKEMKQGKKRKDGQEKKGRKRE